jgi:biopolymer transport protein ExbD
MTSQESGAISSTINVTPLIDVLLVLLIIFMVIVPVTPKGLQAVVPQPSGNSLGPDDAIVVSVLQSQNGKAAYKINRQDVAGNDLLARLTAIYANRAQRVLYIKGEDDVPFAQIAQVMDIGHSAGVDSIGLLSSKP